MDDTMKNPFRPEIPKCPEMQFGTSVPKSRPLIGAGRGRGTFWNVSRPEIKSGRRAFLAFALMLAMRALHLALRTTARATDRLLEGRT
jgi:uncharacterized protein YbbK (DUF523 family)